MALEKFKVERQNLKNKFEQNKRYYTPKELRSFFWEYERFLRENKDKLHSGFFCELSKIETDIEHAIKYKRQSLINEHMRYAINGLESDINALFGFEVSCNQTP